MTQSLTITDGPSQGFVFELAAKQSEIFIGREKSCTLVLDSKSVSRKHALIRQDIDGVWLEDLKSKNGVWLNGSKISKPALLQDEAQIQMGDIHLRFSDSNAAILKKLSTVPAFHEAETADSSSSIANSNVLLEDSTPQSMPSPWLDYVYIGSMVVVVAGLIVGALLWFNN
ncbi:MAG: FHA domain-containing protein [Myxococcaceae bacterium]|nr:FHA domain-containing protein [Myxococcaceae bacterium]MBH2006289.1 FHA domain-containing protein [Myxococcaceae bacterium]